MTEVGFFCVGSEEECEVHGMHTGAERGDIKGRGDNKNKPFGLIKKKKRNYEY